MSTSKKCNIIITGTVQILPAHLELLEKHGIYAERVPYNPPTEEQLLKAVPGKDGYILGSVSASLKRSLTPVAIFVQSASLAPGGQNLFLPMSMPRNEELRLLPHAVRMPKQ